METAAKGTHTGTKSDAREPKEGQNGASEATESNAATLALLAARIAGPSPSGVSLHSLGHPSSGTPACTFEEWQRVAATGSMAVCPSPAMQSTAPVGAACPVRSSSAIRKRIAEGIRKADIGRAEEVQPNGPEFK